MAYLGNSPTTGTEESFKLLDDIKTYTLTFDGSSASAVSTGNDSIIKNKHRFLSGQKVTYTNGGGSDIGGLANNTSYYVIKSDENNIKLATTAARAGSATAINITAVGSGNAHTLNVAFDGYNTKFKATYSGGTECKLTKAAQLTVSVNGVLQQPHDTKSPTSGFGIDNDATIVFSSAPSTSDVFWGYIIGNNTPTFDTSDNKIDNFTGNGSASSFNLSKEPPNNEAILVTIDGVLQYPSDNNTARAYNISGSSLDFTAVPANGAVIQARHIGHAGAVTSAVSSFQGRTGAITIQDADPVVAIQSSSTAIGNVRTLNFVGTGNTFLQRGNVIDIAIAGGGAGAGGTWASSPTGVSTTKSIGINTSTADDPDLVGVGNSFQGLYIGNGMIIVDNQLNGNHYIGTNFNGIMGGPVTVNGVLSVDGNYVVV